MRSVVPLFAFSAMSVGVFVACSSSDSGSGSASDPTTPSGSNPAAANCPDVPVEVLAKNCAASGCHSTVNPSAALDLASPDVAGRLSGKRASGGAGILIDPSAPESSVLYTKLSSSPPFGSRMPSAPAAPLDDGTTACVLSWMKGLGGGGSADGGTDGAGTTPKSTAPPRGKDEFLWLDQMLDFETTNYPLFPDKMPPTNWYAPIDYYDGKIEFRFDVTEKSDATPLWLELCLWQGSPGAQTDACLHCLPLFTGTGTYTCEVSPSDAGNLNLHNGFAMMQHRAKDGTSGRGNDLTTEGHGLPIKGHYQAVIVPKGQTFSGWAAY